MKEKILIILFFPILCFGQNSISYLNTNLSSINSKRESLNTINSNSSFKWIRGMMHVTAQLNGEEGNFILDTGAPLLIVNQKEKLPTTTAASSIAASFSVASLKVDQFSWAGVHHQQLDALALDISHLEKASKQDIQGMIGYSSIKNYELYIDAQQQHISLHKARKNVLHKIAKPVAVIPFAIDDHLPVITVVIGDKKIRLGLDTGAAANILDTSWRTILPTEILDDIHQEKMQGVDQAIVSIEAATIKRTDIMDQNFGTMKYLFTDLSGVNEKTTLQIDGLLGAPFFQKMKCSINYKKGKLYIWEML